MKQQPNVNKVSLHYLMNDWALLRGEYFVGYVTRVQN
jgi:hypothetical protein